MSTPDRGELIVYRTEDGQAEVQLQTPDGSVWLNQGEMAELFDTTKQSVSLNIKNILKDGELPEAATVKESLTVQNEGGRRIAEARQADAEEIVELARIEKKLENEKEKR